MKKFMYVLFFLGTFFTTADVLGQQICATSSQEYVIPAGFALESATYTPSCNQEYPGVYFHIGSYYTTDNSIILYPTHAAPIGTMITICNVFGAPNGWQIVNTAPAPSTCNLTPGNDIVVQHVTCVSTDDNCYPPNPTISYSPNPVVVPYGQSSTNLIVSWAMGQSNPTCVWYQMDDFKGQSPYPSQCAGTSGSETYSVQGGHQYKFWIGNQANDVTVWAQTPIFSVTEGPQPTFSATPNPVVIPAGKTSNTYTLSWNAPYYSQVSIYAVQNLSNPGQIFCLGNASGTGSASEPFQIGEVATEYLTGYSGCTAGSVVAAPPSPLLDTLHLTAVQGAAATLHASVNPVTIPTGQSSAPYTLSWTAPGYSQVSIYASNNLLGSQIYCLGSSGATGSAGESVSSGEVAEIYLTTYSACTAGTVATPPTPYLATLHLTTN